MKTKEIAVAYTLLKGAKLSKMEDEDKFKVIKAMRVMRPIAEKFDKDEKEAADKLKDEKHDEMSEKANQHNEALLSKQVDKLLPASELVTLNMYFNDYQKKLNECLKPLQEEEVPAEFDKLTEEAFKKLLASNDFTVEQMLDLEILL
ncbi:MAG: hypothetical protein LUF01_14485 [Bacteroides sp.]|nr:hypothetical protein [Bacteroides sp.]